ncbi:acetyl-CoA carboxylase biotin carboxyl carrier protein subunit [Aquamicrobium sp. LC103]|uniref:acetyl-CoA carboxylase biotin carboxyl carrier protein n=1 Tax=Aquamicrobium sp. LC103 TaxID=1120658 RepID=UPI00063EB067|nr:acetyl-CoA carboxylase biotin carboxyl carrier protein subunit [Aquamicrobium sp. LC103]TKT78359.1 acetyl-CoA carboxylase biotin carboxyl carrier protein subunit [Aquamicrobium sp. LC103]
MELSKIKTLIEFVGRSNIAELTVTEKGTTVRIFRSHSSSLEVPPAAAAREAVQTSTPDLDVRNASAGSRTASVIAVTAPIFGVLHAAPAPGENAFVKLGDEVREGQTLFIIEAMKVFNKISAPRAGRITRLSDMDGSEVEAGEMLAEIA